MLLNDKTYSKVARDLFSFPVLYRSILVVYRDMFLPFYFLCVAGGCRPSPVPGVVPAALGIQQRGGGGRDTTFVFIHGNTVFLRGICLVLDTGCWGGCVCVKF